MRKLTSLVAAIAALSLLAGCGFKDIDKRFFVIAMGIDRGRTMPYEVTLKLAIPSPKTEPGESNFQLISQEARSVAEAVRLMKSKVDKEFDFGHTKIIVIGKPYAGGELLRSLDWLFRRRDIQQVAYVTLGDPDAKTILSFKPPSERLPGNALILSLSGEGTESPYILPIHLFDYYRRIRSKGLDAYIPIVKQAGETFEINQAALLKGSRIALVLSRQETELLNELDRKFSRVSLHGGAGGRRLELNVESYSRSYDIVTPPAGRPEIRVRVSISGEVEESAVPIFGEDWSRVGRHLASLLEEQYTALLGKMRDAGTDPVGFGLRYRATRHNPGGEWEEWLKLYPQVKFIVHVNVKIRGTGIIR